MQINMVDLKSQYLHIKEEIDQAIQAVIDTSCYINGPAVKSFKIALEQYLNVDTVVPCANGTDALQIALMALDLEPGDEVMVPAFTYVATAEVIALLGLQPVMVDVDPYSFNLTTEIVKQAWKPSVKVIVPVHLYGQSSEMEKLMEFAEEKGIYVIEDNAQSIGADYIFSDGRKQKLGTIGHIGTSSFYPSKNLGAYGDGGAIFTNNKALGHKINMIANHGQSKKYVHDIIGCNSRLDSIQAAILQVKLKYLNNYHEKRAKAAQYYDDHLKEFKQIEIPKRVSHSTHVFHQYTIKIHDNKRDELKLFLKEKDIPTMIYYPLPLYKQRAFSKFSSNIENLKATEILCNQVLSLPIHTELNKEMQDYIIAKIKEFFN